LFVSDRTVRKRHTASANGKQQATGEYHGNEDEAQPQDDDCHEGGMLFVCLHEAAKLNPTHDAWKFVYRT
jgi:hypothetical protein